MNENLAERWARQKKGKQVERRQLHASVLILPPTLNERIREYHYDQGKVPADSPSWVSKAAIPTSSEVLGAHGSKSSSTNLAPLTSNRPQGVWPDKATYLGAHYALLREDAIRPLRFAVAALRARPTANEEAFDNVAIAIFEKVHICGLTCSKMGIALRVTFSIARVGKQIVWEQSKRLASGSLVVLTPATDSFKEKAIVATVAARPLDGLKLNPPEIDLFVARASELEIDPAVEWIMVQDRGGLYEGHKHTLLALQKMMNEKIPLKEHLIDVQPEVPPPHYLTQHPVKNLSSILKRTEHETHQSVDILHEWPEHPQSHLDESQIAALKCMLTKRLAIVQGPPGTGKTFVSVEALKLLLANRSKNDPPILVACQTNHALDQLLRHIAVFEPDFARLGGQSKDKDIIKSRTIYELDITARPDRPANSVFGKANKQMKKLEEEIENELFPLQPDKLPLSAKALLDRNLLSEEQVESLHHGAAQWVQRGLEDASGSRSAFKIWLGQSLFSVPHKRQPEEHGFAVEEADLEFEHLEEHEAENGAKDEDDRFESLSGRYYSLAENFTTRDRSMLSVEKIEALLGHEQDMWKIPEKARGAVYRYLQSALKDQIRDAVRSRAEKYDEQAALRRIGTWEIKHEPILKTQKIVGMTTTGLGKYRGLIASLQPKIVIIEEAAETLEAPVITACVPTLEHLILVGDHKQLRPHCQVRQFEDKPYYLNISLFERLVRNKIDFVTLTKQRRMIPEIRRCLYPIYEDCIEDHDSVTTRPDVPGMGGINSWFFNHDWSETRDGRMSAMNHDEASMIVGFVKHLVWNGVQAKDITILTFYNGPRKLLSRQLCDDCDLQTTHFRVVTVDSYQGEENKIVILSLTRSNDHGDIGFLASSNRICVALSRAQCGFYLFGNGKLLFNKSRTWETVLEIMAGNKNRRERPKTKPRCRVQEKFPIRCTRHNNLVELTDPADWQKINGGCDRPCGGKLPCGHRCELTCHPFPEDQVNCRQRCGRKLSCGHACSAPCASECECMLCGKSGRGPAHRHHTYDTDVSGIKSRSRGPVSSSSRSTWVSYAENESSDYAKRASEPPFLTPSIAHRSSRKAIVDRLHRASDSPEKHDTQTEGDAVFTSVTDEKEAEEEEDLIDLS